MIPIGRPDIGEEEIAAAAMVLRSGMIAQDARVAERLLRRRPTGTGRHLR